MPSGSHLTFATFAGTYLVEIKISSRVNILSSCPTAFEDKRVTANIKTLIIISQFYMVEGKEYHE